MTVGSYLEVFMNNFIKSYWKTLLFFAVIGIIGGFFTGIYLLDSYPADVQQQFIDEMKSAGISGISPDILLGLITALQSLAYGFVLGALGIYLAKKIGLWKDEIAIEKKPLLVTVILSVFSGVMLILPDIFLFGYYSEAIMASYAAKPTVAYILATVTYGAVIEEVMLRLFMMSLIAFILHKIFGKGEKMPSTPILVVANLISSLLFAAGHLPATFSLLGNSAIIVIRCFLLNGVLGLLFGYLYRKYGLRYAMIAHGGCHLISKLIWVLFI